MTDVQQPPRIPEFGSLGHRRQIAARLSKNLRWRLWLEDLKQGTQVVDRNR